MTITEYTGPIGPATTMSSVDPEFHAAYSYAVDEMLAAVTRFERVTGRIVDSIALERLDVTSFASPIRQHVRQVEMHFLPTPGEISW